MGKALQQIKKHVKPGHVYRRKDLEVYSSSVDRHLLALQKDDTLKKLSGGLYYCPERSVFGETPPKDQDLIKSFLQDHRFLITSFNHYNKLGVGTTQLYSDTLVYNHKRSGKFKLGNRTFKFVKKNHFPRKLSEEFLIVDLINNLQHLAEDSIKLLNNIKDRALSMDPSKLRRNATIYGNVRTRKLLQKILKPIKPNAR